MGDNVIKTSKIYTTDKPPLGLTPRAIYEKQCVDKRIEDILAAMYRYSLDDKPVPVEWVNELGELLNGEREYP